MRRNDKRASLELSIRAIVIVVLAMTLLGLGLGMIRNVFKDIGGISSDVTEQVKGQLLDDLITSDKKLSFPKTQINIDKGDSVILSVGVRNKGDNVLNYKMRFTAVSGPGVFDTPPINPTQWFQYGLETYTLGPTDSEVRNMRLSIPSSGANAAQTGSYFLTFDIMGGCVTSTGIPPTTTCPDIYATKDLFIVVSG